MIDLNCDQSRADFPTRRDYNEDEFFAAEAEFPLWHARGHQLAQKNTEELLDILGVGRDIEGFRTQVHINMAMFVEVKIDNFCTPINDEVLQTLAAVASGDYSALQGTGRGAVIVRSILEHYALPTTSALATLEDAGRLVGIAASLKEEMRKERKGRPVDDVLDNFLRGYNALAADVGAPMGLGSNQTIGKVVSPLVKSTKRVLSLVAERGLAVLANRPAMDEVRALDAAAYFKDLGNMDARRIATRLWNLRKKEKERKKRLGQ